MIAHQNATNNSSNNGPIDTNVPQGIEITKVPTHSKSFFYRKCFLMSSNTSISRLRRENVNSLPRTKSLNAKLFFSLRRINNLNRHAKNKSRTWKRWLNESMRKVRYNSNSNIDGTYHHFHKYVSNFSDSSSTIWLRPIKDWMKTFHLSDNSRTCR